MSAYVGGKMTRCSKCSSLSSLAITPTGNSFCLRWRATGPVESVAHVLSSSFVTFMDWFSWLIDLSPLRPRSVSCRRPSLPPDAPQQSIGMEEMEPVHLNRHVPKQWAGTHRLRSGSPTPSSESCATRSLPDARAVVQSPRRVRRWDTPRSAHQCYPCAIYPQKTQRSVGQHILADPDGRATRCVRMHQAGATRLHLGLVSESRPLLRDRFRIGRVTMHRWWIS